MKYILIALLHLSLIPTLISQSSPFEKYDVIDLYDYDSVIGIAPRLIETIGDSLLLIGGGLSRYYLYDVKLKQVVRQKELNVDWNMATDMIKTKDEQRFIINYDWGLLFLDLELNIVKQMEIESSNLMEIKLSDKGTVFQRTESLVREIDVNKFEVIHSFDFPAAGYDIELTKNEILLTNGNGEVVRTSLTGEPIEKIKLSSESEIIEGLYYADGLIYAPSPFENKVMISNLASGESSQWKLDAPNRIAKLSSGELIIGDANGEIKIYKDHQLLQTIIQEAQEYGPNHPFINHIEMTDSEQFLIFTGESSNRIFIYRKNI